MLDAMRLTGDDTADAVIKDLFAAGDDAAAHALLTLTQLTYNDDSVPSSMPSALRDFLHTTMTLPLPDAARLDAAQSYALPDAYAASAPSSCRRFARTNFSRSITLDPMGPILRRRP
jgi:hypothetical protein